MSAHDDLHAVIYEYFGSDLTINSYKSPDQQDHELTDAIIAAGYVKVSEAAIERAAEALCVQRYPMTQGWWPKVDPDFQERCRNQTRAVIAALREEA